MNEQIGKQYKARVPHSKHKKLCTVIDVHTTYNKDGEKVKTRYVSEHDFLGQKIIDRDVALTTILMNEVTQ